MRELRGLRRAARLPLLAVLTAGALVVPATPALADDADTVVALVNEEREAAGCSPVSVDDALTEAAGRHSRDQAERGEMGHEGSDGSRVGDRATDAGYRWSSIGENVASGTTSPERAMQLWMESSGHRKNILNCKFQDIGVARVDGYWTQDFGTPR
ncbi:CAP domain-containing protein [Pseudonocardia kunmingensis]|uniref:Cysteine-rich secretory family protein n=1 Tax=Pseudonocardia kunmingensis TaxID=630975 RepID=A0A543DL18_9PSEU|nr:CAP domain-containing protein [Pseudonocardia kunmingensis]TQM10040.1 cysteine-rich secretory family protein [Pseudonocardia kunmingensis]